MAQSEKISATTIASYVLAALALLTVLKAGLLIALFSGLLVYSLIHLLAPLIARKFSSYQSRVIAVVFLAVLIISAITIGVWSAFAFLRSDAGNLHTLLQKLADIIEASRHQMPDWVHANLPDDLDDVDDLRAMITNWLREHSSEAKLLGQEAGHMVVHLLLGMIIGAMVALQDATMPTNYRPFALALHERIEKLAMIFQKIVFAQVQISLINTVLTAIYLLVILPMAGVHLPLTKSMIAITFLAGLIPVAGNIISNSVIVTVGLSHSLNIALASLAFMIVVHKLEYFLNAKIIGAHINARAWELLTAILVMETLFGIPGVVAAPVFYAYIKAELSDRGLV
ncbi:AI-2E family transporter [Undibacterium sp.]|uniref:AI-2E family transporter n=1 Tax=Undibacterium sp. TaxID=1914977 RepID=UPI00374D928D